MAKRIEIKDWADKNTTFILEGAKALGRVEMVCRTEFRAYREDGSFIDWFPSKAAAVRAL